MKAFTPDDDRHLKSALSACGADGWLLFNFQGHNPVANRFLGLGGLGSRRLFVMLRPGHEPVAVAHRIELQPMAGLPGRVVPYSKWQELHAAVVRENSMWRVERSVLRLWETAARA